MNLNWYLLCVVPGIVLRVMVKPLVVSKAVFLLPKNLRQSVGVRPSIGGCSGLSFWFSTEGPPWAYTTPE